ncbi:MAG TPA: ankyrin repeat domain-containing protein, partial [Vicinamibacterales bacterium]|nr:ankyrin repeat domain-containing protein [Vicinamibacterales bacterium]
ADEVRYLISRGADLKVRDAFKNTLLTAATVGNDIDTIRLAVDAGIDVNAAAVTGFTPLFQAASEKNVEAVKLLISRGADVNAVVDDAGLTPSQDPKTGPVQLRSYTALLSAAALGPPELIKALVDAGANVNATDSRKFTPLMLAVATDHQDPDVIGLLLARGADAAQRGPQFGTPVDWASEAGGPDGIALLHAPKPRITAAAVTAAPLDPKAAVQKSLGLLETTTQTFFEKSGCISCHAQPITSMAAAEASLKGIRVDQKLMADRTRQLETSSIPPFILAEQLDIQVPEIVADGLVGLAAAGQPSDRTTDAMAINVSRYQDRDGAWHQLYGSQARPGAEDGDIFRTALGVRALSVYGPRGRAKEMDDRIARAREWLMHAKTVTADDRNMQLLGLVWAGAPAAAVKPLADSVLAHQQPDGGWRQHDALGTDALATGQSLYALAKSGLPASDPRYQKGVHYLLTTQRTSDGSWRVESRAPKFQTFFQSGFPYAGDQWISAWATGWSTMALAQVLP